MTSKKQRLGNNLSSLLEASPLPLSLEKLVGKSSSKSKLSSTSSLILSPDLSLERLAEDLGAPQLETSIDLFIDKYGSSPYASLDELLDASIQKSQLEHTYMDTSKKESDNLFEGLGDLLDF